MKGGTFLTVTVGKEYLAWRGRDKMRRKMALVMAAVMTVGMVAAGCSGKEAAPDLSLIHI